MDGELLEGRIFRVECEEGVKIALDLFEANSVTLANSGEGGARARPTLPIMIGAGVSASAGVPLNDPLLETLSQKLRLDTTVLDYEELYSKLMGPKFGDYRQDSYMKPELRNWLVESGIPRFSDAPLPNISNLLISHLLLNDFIGPVISFNVDPLLATSGLFFDNRRVSARTFVQNASQFSDLLDQGTTGDNLVFQPHGTIEEPLSLRFADRELISDDKENALRDVLVGALRKRVGLLSVGVNFIQKTAVRLVSQWATNNPENRLDLLTTSYGQIQSEELENLTKLTEKHKHLTVTIAEGTDSDDFWNRLTKKAVEKTWRQRSTSETLYHVPPASELELQLEVCETISDRLHPKSGQYRKLPDEERWLVLQICIHAIVSRGPFKLGDLVKSCSTKRAFRSLFETPDGIKTFSNAVQKTLASGLLSVAERGDSVLGEVDLENYRSFEDIGSMLVVRGSAFGDPESFAIRLYELLDLRIKNLDTVVDLVRKIELDRESYFDKIAAIPAHLFFEDSEILDSHFELDHQLDTVKGQFAEGVTAGRNVRGLVITERGEHLFKNIVLEGLVSFQDYEGSGLELVDCVRSWIVPILDSPHDEGQELSIIIADQPSDWVFDHGERAERDKIINDLIQRLDKFPNIDVRVLPWDKHDDHMWVLDAEGGEGAVGILFPRPHGQKSYFGLRVRGDKEVNKLVEVFDRHFRDARPINHEKINHVMALTIVDKSNSSGSEGVSLDDRILVGVRDAGTNAQHSNIACVPTRRIPSEVFEGIASCGNRISGSGAKSQVLEAAWSHSGRGEGHDPVGFGVESIMSRKLGLAEAQELGTVKYSSTPRILKSDYSPKFSEQDVDEYLAMLNVLVFLKDGKDSIPKRTASYSRLEWVRVGDFLDALKENGDRGELLLGADEGRTPFLCGGVCVCTTEVLLSEISSPIA